ncbi:MAG: DUF4160 domain-containing protein [Bacteroides sp.]|nr:DUF4160 domain-containing protein [Bacteroides sp.]MCM1457861.1 DUF4160 domain-containing protein [Lachnoclostridium sp.]
MHVHANKRPLRESGSAKFFVKNNGDTTVENSGILTEKEIAKIRSFIKDNYLEMYLIWQKFSNTSFYRGENANL